MIDDDLRRAAGAILVAMHEGHSLRRILELAADDIDAEEAAVAALEDALDRMGGK